MKSLRSWIVIVAIGSFVAGVSAGLVVPALFAAEAGRQNADESYVRQMTADYGLSTAQQRSLRLVMRGGREEELRILEAVDPVQLPTSAQGRLLAARGRLQQRIRAILDEGQRTRYDLASRQR